MHSAASTSFCHESRAETYSTMQALLASIAGIIDSSVTVTLYVIGNGRWYTIMLVKCIAQMPMPIAQLPAASHR
jgi:hypothetical protein